MKNTTLTMVAVLAAVTMLSAVLAVPMQQANAEDRDGKDGKDRKDGKDSKDGDGDNKVIIKQSNECEEVIIACGNFLDGEIDQNSGEDDFPPGPPI
jgi:hypothetical protein